MQSPNLIDITHTTKPSDRPHPDAKLFRNLATGNLEWQGIPEPEPKPVKPTKGVKK